MKIHSDTLTDAQIRECVPEGCYLAAHYNERADHEDWASVHVLGSRRRERAYSVRLSGSSNYRMQRLPDKSATWSEWGIFIAALYDLDPEAIIGQYTSRENFMEVTQAEYERRSRYQPDLGVEVPWLRSSTLTYDEVMRVFAVTDALRETD